MEMKELFVPGIAAALVLIIVLAYLFWRASRHPRTDQIDVGPKNLRYIPDFYTAQNVHGRKKPYEIWVPETRRQFFRVYRIRRGHFFIHAYEPCLAGKELVLCCKGWAKCLPGNQFIEQSHLKEKLPSFVEDHERQLADSFN